MTLAEKIYTVYCASVGGKAFNGDPLPDWETFRSDPKKLQQSTAWMDAADAAVEYLMPPAIAQKTVGMLVDELITTDIKCFMAQEKIMLPVSKITDGDRSLAAAEAQSLNKRRNELIRAIDFASGQGSTTPTDKTY